MKKLSIIPVVCSFMFFACSGDDTNTEVSPPKPDPASINISVTSNTSVLKTDNNTDFIIQVENAYEAHGYKSNITLNNDTNDNFTISQGDSLSGYMFSLKPNKKETRVYNVDVSVTDENNNMIASENILLGALKKLYPIYDTEKNIPALDNEFLEIKNNENKIVILTPNKKEYNYTRQSDSWVDTYSSIIPIITSYGYGQSKDNVTSSNGFTVDNQEEKFTVKNTDYKNCIKLKSAQISSPCAIKISYNGSGEETTFTINTQDRYLPATIKIKGTP